jgi:hypothetical protein
MTAVALFCCPSLLYAEKTDTVILKNGNTIIGEIKKLDRGMLEYSTDDMGTIHIEWNKIAYISSRDSFDIELQTGQRFFGSIQQAPEEGKLMVSGAKARGVLNMSSVISIVPLEATFRDRLKGKLDLGFSYKKANKSTQLTLNGNFNHRTKNYLTELNVESSMDDRDDVDKTSRNDASLALNRFLGDRWLIRGGVQFQQNDELNLDSRYILGMGGGRYMLQTNSLLLSASAGLQGTREVFIGSDEATFNLEALAVGEFSIFRYDDPKTDISTKLQFFPNLTTWGRYRVDFNINFDYELYKDFFLGLSFFDNYDSKPPVADAEKNDFGVTTSIGYKFN